MDFKRSGISEIVVLKNRATCFGIIIDQAGVALISMGSNCRLLSATYKANSFCPHVPKGTFGRVLIFPFLSGAKSIRFYRLHKKTLTLRLSAKPVLFETGLGMRYFSVLNSQINGMWSLILSH